MIRKYAVIQMFDKNYWYYWTNEETWSAYVPRARQFPSKEIAELFLSMQKNWDGHYSIQECFTQYVSK